MTTAFNPMEIPKVDFDHYLEHLSFKESDNLIPVDNFTPDVLEHAINGQIIYGTELPWSNINAYTRLGEGKLSIWAGQSGSGKSLILGQVIGGILAKGQKATIASLEMKPVETLYRMICQAAACKAGEVYCSRWLDKFKGALWIYDELDRVDTNRILAMTHYSAKELNVQHVVIDSLTKCGVGRDDYAKQAEFVDKLQWCAKSWNIHIHLVCHMRKSDQTGKNDIRGAAEITDLADNVFILDRNRLKERENQKQLAGARFDEKIMSQPDAFLKVEKNRQFGHELGFGLYFDLASGNYKQSRNAPLSSLNL